MIWRAVAFLCATLSLGCSKEEPQLCDESPGALFEQRIEPLLMADHPSTCGQCHAGGLDLESFLRPDPCESMACLKAEGLVNLEHPEQSVILSFIERAEPETELVTADVIAEEHEAFLSWIEYEAECQSCAETVCSGRAPTSCEHDSPLEAAFDEESDPGDCERTTVERLFRGTIYENRGRCSPCHYVEETMAAPEAPRWMHRTGDCMVSSLATLRAIEEAEYIDVNAPGSSLLLMKPLAEFDGGLPHGGHDKFVLENDDTYDAFSYFVSRYAACEIGAEFSSVSGGGAGGAR